MLREPADSWLLGALLVFFSVAVAAALPPITASIRTAMADAAKGTQGKTDVGHRDTVRAQLHAARAALANAASGSDFLPETAPVAPAPIAGADVFDRPFDFAQRIEERGFSARAPPQV